jgi:hypothetical protein
MTPTARAELRRYVQSRKQKWSFTDIADAAVALACAVGLLVLVIV